MTAVKVTGLVMIFMSAVLMGLAYGEKAATSLKLLEALRRILNIMRGEINYSMPVLSELLIHISERSNGVWSEFWGESGRNLASGNVYGRMEDIWEEQAVHAGLDKMLHTEDYGNLIRFCKDIADLDRESLIGRVDMYIDDLDSRIMYLKNDIDKRVKLCRVLGVAGGSFMILILA